MTLVEISKAHRNAFEVAKRGVTVYQVTNKDIRAFDAARRDLQQSVENLQAAEPLKTFASLCSQIHARICRTPCSPAWLVETFKPRLHELQPRLKPILAAADERLRTAFKAVCDRLADVQKLPVNPLADEVRAMLDLSEEASEHLIVVIRQPALWPNVKAALNPDNQRKQMVIMKPSELRRASPVDRVLLFGPPWLFEYRDEHFLFRSPVAGSIELFVFAHDCGGEVSASSFDVQNLIFKGIGARPRAAENLQSEPLFMFKPRTFVPREFPGTTGDQTNAHAVSVDAWPVHLGGNLGTYLDPEGSIFAVNCVHDGEQALCTGVERRDVEELEPGDLVVLTTEGGGDLIRPLADEILGTLAQVYRPRQEEWKRKLIEIVAADGMPSVVNRLRALGSFGANTPNLRNWMSERNIGPNNLNADFNAILALVGLDDAREEYSTAIDAIRRAHQSAGFQLHGRLRNALKGMDVRKAFVDGYLEVRTEEGGPAKTVFLVEQIARELSSVPSHAVARVFELEETKS
jgi:hypothetical protein